MIFRRTVRLVAFSFLLLSAVAFSQNAPDVLKLGLKGDDFAKDLVETVCKEAPGSKILIVVIVDRSPGLQAEISDTINRLIPHLMNKVPAAESAWLKWGLVDYADGAANCVLQPTSSPDELVDALKRIEPREATKMGTTQALNYVQLVARQPVARSQKTYFVLLTGDQASCGEDALQPVVEALRGGKAVLYVVGLKGKAAPKEAAARPAAPGPPTVDLAAYYEAVRPVNDRIDGGDYDAALSRAILLSWQYPDLIKMKLANLDRIESLRRRSFDRVNRGIVKIAMGDVARGYAFAGTITEADEKGLKADSASKGWDKFTKQEKATFYRKAGGDETAEGLMDVAAFLVEGTAGEQDYEQALDLLGKATRLGADTSSCLKYIETLRRAAKESAAARAKGTAPPAKTTEKEKAESAKQEAGAEKKEEPTGRAFDDVYVTTAATGEKIPHPLSRKTYRITHLLKKIDVPEGMVYVPSGKFKMGEKETEHEVYLDAYFIGKYEVTNAEWKAFVDATGFPPPLHWKGGEIPPGKENHPIVYVSWEDIQKYCEWASHGTVREVHLPTEAQWEKAARGPRGHQYPWGDAWDKRLCNSGWRLGPFGFRPNDEADDWKKKWEEWEKSDKGKEIIAAGGDTTAAGSFPKGKCFYGCYDMAGNAYEWCRDWFITNYYTLKDAKRNPQGPTEEQAEEFDFRGHKSKARVLRGGVWSSHSIHCRTIRRYIDCPSAHNSNYGFRVVVSPAP